MSQLPNPSRPQQEAAGTRLILVALGLALFTVLLVNLYIARERRRVQVEQMTVWVLKHEVRPGDKIQERDLTPLEIPNRFDKSMTAIGVMDEEQKELHVRERREFKRNGAEGQLLTHELFGEQKGAKFTDIPDGFYIVHLPVKSKSQTGMIKPGYFVDVAAPFQAGGAVPQTLIVMQRVKVLALGTVTEADVSGDPTGSKAARNVRSYTSATIAVKQDVALKLSNVTRIITGAGGEYELYLRASDDNTNLRVKPNEISEEVEQILKKTLRGQPGPATPGTGG